MPRKTFVAGEILTASDTNTYLMDQAVMTFAGTAARGSAIPTPSEGMVTYLEDTDAVEVYTTDWQVVGGNQTGNIVQVVSATYGTAVSTSSTSFVTTNLTATITPSSASNKILVLGHFSLKSTSDQATANWTLFRGTVAGTNLGNTPGMGWQYQGVAGASVSTHAVAYLDSPSTTSAQTYTIGFKEGNVGTTTVTVHDGSTLSSIVLLEVAG